MIFIVLSKKTEELRFRSGNKYFAKVFTIAFRYDIIILTIIRQYFFTFRLDGFIIGENKMTELLREQIEERACQGHCATVMSADDTSYVLAFRKITGVKLSVIFDSLDQKPQVGDKLYFSDKMISDFDEGLRCFVFSTRLGIDGRSLDFNKNPEEFLIFESANEGKIILLERWYG